MPHVERIEGRPTWVFDGHPLGPASAGAVIGRDGRKVNSCTGLFEWTHEMAHQGGWDPKARLQVMDECGISAQVIYPNTIGLGGQDLGVLKDENLCQTAIRIYNDAMVEIQADSRNRLLPMPLMPAWSVEASIAEARRVAALGARGVNMTQDPQDLGAPDFASRAWDPFWEVCTDLQLPVHFHIGASVTAMTFFGKYPWASHATSTQLAIGGTLLFVGNARIVVNTILSGMFDRHPDLKMVSVESGIGWIPFILEALDYEMAENAPEELAQLKKPPSEYFRSNMYATFWFERNRNKLPDLVEAVGEDNILFETDFPHPTCLYPNPLQTVEAKMATLSPEVRRKILGGNAKQLYRL
jgi:predicted TIM-barrel fold metal-dependent hydrolase